MKNPIVNKNFLLQTKVAKTLYHNYASKMPIIDYHCHLLPKEIAENRVFENLSQIWLEGDHYKWRAMRANGIGEEYISGKYFIFGSKLFECNDFNNNHEYQVMVKLL